MKKRKNSARKASSQDHVEIFIKDNGSVEFHNITRMTLPLIGSIARKPPRQDIVYCG